MNHIYYSLLFLIAITLGLFSCSSESDPFIECGDAIEFVNEKLVVLNRSKADFRENRTPSNCKIVLDAYDDYIKEYKKAIKTCPGTYTESQLDQIKQTKTTFEQEDGC